MSKASFILPTKNVKQNIGPLLESIFSQEYDGDIEVLIMDSSDDETPEIAKKFPTKLVTVDPDDYNYGGTRNEGAAMTDGDFLVFLSTDIEIRDRKWLSKLTSHFADPQVAGVYGRQLPKEGATEEEILLHQRQLATQYDYFASVGLRYTFGSIYSNVVNPRFGGND